MPTLVVYNASAGSGKTYTLAREYILQIIRRPMEYRSILAVTFTNKATEEMKTRIIGELYTLAKHQTGNGKEPNYLAFLVEELQKELGNPAYEQAAAEISERAQRVLTAILHDYSNFAISTIDKFFQKVVRNFVRELNIQPGYVLELDGERVLSLAVDKVLEGLHEDEQLQRWLFELVEERLNEGESWELSGILNELGKQLMREEFRMQNDSFYEKINDKSFLDEYFKRLQERSRAAEKRYIDGGKRAMEFFRANGIDFSDIPGGKTGFASLFEKAGEGKFPDGYAKAAAACNSLEDWLHAKKPRMTEAVYSTLNPILCELVHYLDTERNTFEVAIKNFRTLGVLADIDRQVRELAAEDNLLLISDTSYIVSKLIEGTDAPFIYEKMGNRFTSYLIDEFQDTSSQQYGNFRPLLENSIAQGGYAMVVGDVKQNIYRWRGGDWLTLGRRVFEDFDAQKISLDTNFRSKRNVVEFNNAIFPVLAQSLEGRYAESGLTTQTISTIYEDVTQQVPNSPSKEGGFVRLERMEATDEETSDELYQRVMHTLVAQIVELQDERGFHPSDIAVLVRRQKEGQMVAEALLEARNASHSEGQHRFNFISQGALYLSSSAAINLIVAVLRLSITPTDSISAALVSYIEKIEQGRPVEHGYFEAETSQRILDLIGRIENLPLPEAVEAIIAEYHLNTIIDELPFIGGFCDAVLGFATQKISDVSSFVEWWDERGCNTELYLPNQEEAITILTVHKSKGLQYKVVLMPFASWEYEPSSGLRKSTLWVDGSPLEMEGDYLDVIPVDYSKALLKSDFAGAGYTEQLQSYIDNINLAYVALTRAEQELYIYIPKGKRAGDNIGEQLFAAALTLPWVQLEEREDGQPATVATFGEKGHGQPKAEEAGNVIPLTSFKIGKPLSKIKQNYAISLAQESGNLKKGLLMHRLFSLVGTLDDLPSAIDTLIDEGLMMETERQEILNEVKSKTENPVVAGWFNPQFEVINEGDIILPGEEYRVRRPDRVMRSANHTVVVDFKFGEIEDEKHRYQVFGYINTLKKMGYPNVSGYLWYFDHNNVVELH